MEILGTDKTDSLTCKIIYDNFTCENYHFSTNTNETEANTNAKKKPQVTLHSFELFLANKGETSAIEEITPADLDRYLSKFLVSVRKDMNQQLHEDF